MNQTNMNNNYTTENMFSTNNETEPCHTYNTMTDLNSARSMLNKDDRFARSLALSK